MSVGRPNSMIINAWRSSLVSVLGGVDGVDIIKKAGKFVDEIVPLTVNWTNPKSEQTHKIVIDSDDGIHKGITAESLGKLKPAFSKDGSMHAGNASQVSDGAAAVLLTCCSVAKRLSLPVLLTRRSVAKRLGLPVLGKFVAAQVAGVPPRIMGVGPAVAIPKVLTKTGLAVEDIDFEINDTFASLAQHLPHARAQPPRAPQP